MKIAIIGGSGHFEYAVESALQSNIVAYAPGSENEDLSRLESLALDFSYYANYQELIKLEKPHVVVVNPHYYLNGNITKYCLSKGIHVFCEKPLAFTIDDANEIMALSKSQNAFISTMQIHRYEPWFYAAYLAYKQGRVGGLIQASAQKSYKMGVKPDWMKDKSKFGGIIPWVGAHAVDWIVWLLGTDLQVVQAHQSTIGNAHQGEVESNASILLKYNKTSININLDYLRPEGADTHGDDRLRLVGEHGIIEVIDSKATLIDSDGEHVLTLEKQPNIFDDFINSIKIKTENRNPIKDILTVNKLCWEAENYSKNY